MKKFQEFINKNFTLSVLISVISFRIYVSLLDNIINPITFDIIDKHKNFSKFKINVRDITINVGEFLKDLISTLLIVLLIYNLVNFI